MSKKYLWLAGGVLVLLLVAFFMQFSGWMFSSSSGLHAIGGGASSKMVADGDRGESASYGIGANAAYDEVNIAPVPSEPRADTSNVQERLIIKTANVSMVVDDVTVAIDQIARQAVEKGGFVVHQSVSKQGVGFNGYITFRIPSADFDAQLQSFSSLGDVASQSVNGQDVTEEYVDVSAQLDNLRRTEAQFQQILTRATSIEDILAVQRELTIVRSQIERLEGRKIYLEQSAQLSTITVHLSTNPDNLPVLDESDTWRPLAIAKDAVRGLRSAGIAVANAIIWITVYIPLWLVLGGVFWLVRHLWHTYAARS